jgi:AraC-like DNA-binding protein
MPVPVHQVKQHRSSIPGIEAMSLVSNHHFPRHSHEQFGIGVVHFGAHHSWSGVGHVEAFAGDVIMVNPDEIHDGTPVGGVARGWQIIYFEPSLVAREIEEEEIVRRAEILRPVARDPHLAQLVVRLFACLSAPSPDAFATEETLLRSLLHALRRHGVAQPRSGGPPPSIAKALRRLNAAPQSNVTLAELAALSGVSRFQLLRGFVRELGITPHAYLVQRRVRLARRFLAQGQTPVQAALNAGFADQSHMTRAFLRHIGVTPARYQAALA